MKSLRTGFVVKVQHDARAGRTSDVTLRFYASTDDEFRKLVEHIEGFQKPITKGGIMVGVPLEIREVVERSSDERARRHQVLHDCLDELLADMLVQTDKLPSTMTVLELMQWSSVQTRNPTGES